MKIFALMLAIAVVCHGAPQIRPQIKKTLDQLKQQIAEVHNPVVVEEEEPVVQTKISNKGEIGEEEIARMQAENAKYEFDTDVVDGINGHSHQRSEKRNGLALEGSYSYSDGFFRRTVSYIADENGFRIVKEINEPIGHGPVIDVNGSAKIHSSLGAEYEITVDDLIHRPL